MKTRIRKLLREQFPEGGFSTEKYMSFDDLMDNDLHDIAQWGLMNDFSSSGAWDCGEDDLDAATECVVDSFRSLLRNSFPDGFNGIPDIVTIYRMVVLKDPSELNRVALGQSWFTNPNRINDPDFKQQLWHLKTEGLYLMTAKTPQNNINVPRSLWQRDAVWIENEVVLKDDSPSKVKILSLKKLK